MLQIRDPLAVFLNKTISQSVTRSAVEGSGLVLLKETVKQLCAMAGYINAGSSIFEKCFNPSVPKDFWMGVCEKRIRFWMERNEIEKRSVFDPRG